ncbi:MAG: YfhO family protein [Clostridiales bacterium]|nr:YfhO family protein [Clostridiales bacterium]
MNEHNKKKAALFPYLILYTFLFGLMCIFVFWRFWKTGTSFVWHTDGWNQHIRALQFYLDWLQQIVRGVIKDATLSIPMWSECIGYGSDIVTTLHYYVIGDPLCLLSIFVPDRYMVDFYNAMIIFRLYLAGISFSAFMYYLKKNSSLITNSTEYATNNKNNSAKKFITISAWLAGVFVYLFSGYTFVPNVI